MTLKRGRLLLLSGYFVPLALTLLAAELYNILAFHLTLAPETIVPARVASVLWVLVFLLFEPGERTGKFRLGKDDLIVDASGNSRISMEDYAIALVDELEKPKHRGERFTIGY